MFGVMYARPFAAREGFYIWPWTFFLFVLSAIACGPCFTILCTKLTEFLSRKKLVPDDAIQFLAKLSGWLAGVVHGLKSFDYLAWMYGIVPRAGLTFMDFFKEGPYGVWMVVLEMFVCGFLPAIILLTPAGRKNQGWLIFAALLNCTGIVLNRFFIHYCDPGGAGNAV
jgi:Ni/Fe-hydrogenase subunit HybB-like protein